MDLASAKSVLEIAENVGSKNGLRDSLDLMVPAHRAAVNLELQMCKLAQLMTQDDADDSTLEPVPSLEQLSASLRKELTSDKLSHLASARDLPAPAVHLLGCVSLLLEPSVDGQTPWEERVRNTKYHMK